MTGDTPNFRVISTLNSITNIFFPQGKLRLSEILFTSLEKLSTGPRRAKKKIVAFDEGRTLPNLLGCLLSRRFPVHASERWPVFFRSMVHLFGAILNDVTISLRKAFCLVLRCLSDVLEGSSFIAVWSVSYFVMLLKNFVGVIYQSLRKVCATSGPCTSTRTCFVLNGSRCLIELTRCGRKSNQPSSVAWPLCQPTRCGRKTNQPSNIDPIHI